MTAGAVSRAKLQSNHHHRQINIQFFYRPDALPVATSCRPTNSVKALKGKISHSMDLLTPSSPGGLPTLSLTTNISGLPRGRVAMPLISPLMPVPPPNEHHMYQIRLPWFSRVFDLTDIKTYSFQCFDTVGWATGMAL